MIFKKELINLSDEKIIVEEKGNQTSKKSDFLPNTFP